MVAQKGKDLLLKVHNGAVFETVAGLRSKRLAFNAETVDITDAESAGRWRELLGGAGVQRASVSGAGIFKDAVSDGLVRAAFFNGAQLADCGAGFRHGERPLPGDCARIFRRP